MNSGQPPDEPTAVSAPRWYQRLDARVVGGFITATVLSAAAQFYVQFDFIRDLTDDVDQRLYWSLAADLVGDGTVRVRGRSDIGPAIERLRMLFPAGGQFDACFLSSAGDVLGCTAEQPKKPISTATLEERLTLESPPLPARFRDPFGRSEHVTPSVERIDLDGEQGYFLITVRRLIQDRFESRPYWYLAGIEAFMTWFLFLAGLSVLFVFIYRRLTRTLRTLRSAANRFASGDLSARALPGGQDEVGRVARAFNRLADEYERRIAEISAAVRREKEMLVNIAHDLRTPLTSMLGFIETLGARGREASIPPAERERYLAAVERSAAQQRALVADLEQLTELQGEDRTLVIAPLEPAQLVEDLVLQFRASAEQKGLTIASSADAGLPPLFADRLLLERALFNLISNAIRYTPAGGAIDVSAAETPLPSNGTSIVFSVRDTGIGIPESELPHIFEEFFRANTSRPEDPGGSGVGLAIVRRIAERHGGTVTAESTVDVGTAFRLTVPCAPVAVEPSRSTQSTVTRSYGEPELSPLSALSLSALHAVGAIAMTAVGLLYVDNSSATAASYLFVSIALAAIVSLIARATTHEFICAAHLSLAWTVMPFLAGLHRRGPGHLFAGTIIGAMAVLTCSFLCSRRARALYFIPVAATSIVVAFLMNSPELFVLGLMVGPGAGLFGIVFPRLVGREVLWVRIAVAFVAISAIGTPLRGVRLAWDTFSMVEELIEPEVASFATAAAKIFRNDPTARDLDRLAYRLTQLTPFADYRIFDTLGQLLMDNAAADRGGSDLPPPTQLRVRYILEDTPASIGLGNIEAIEVTAPGKRYRFYVRKVGQYHLAIGLIVGVILSFWVGTVLAVAALRRPGNRLRRLAEALERSKISEIGRLPAEGNDEVASLSSVLSSTARSVERMSEELERIRRERHRLVARVAEEIKTPLDRIHPLIAELRSAPSDAEPALIRRLHSQLIRQSRLVEDLFELSKVDVDRKRFEIEEFSITDLLWDAAGTYQADLAQSGVALNVDGGAVPLAEGDIEVAVRAIQAVLDNCVNAALPGTSINVSAREQDGRIVVVVADDGRPFPPELVEHALNPFAEAWKEADFDARTSDLGLLVAERLVSASGGTLIARRTERTEFELSLPAAGV